MSHFKEWFFLQEKGKKEEEKFEEQNKEIFFWSRIAILVSIIICFPPLSWALKELYNFHNFNRMVLILQSLKILGILISVIIFYGLILLYKEWFIKLGRLLKIGFIMNKLTNFLKGFLRWFFLAEQEHEKKFGEKNKIWLNVIRLIVLILLVLLFADLYNLINITDTSNQTDPWRYAVLIFVIYTLLILYKDWIKNCWKFLKKDSIVHYIFLAIIPAAIIFYGYQYVHVGIKAGNSKPDASALELKAKELGISSIPQTKMTVKEVISEYDEVIDRLNGFYSALFTAIAVIAAILALGAWKTLKELREKLDKFKDVEEKVAFLHEKKDLAKWAQELFDKDDKKRIISSADLPILSSDDRDKYERIKEKIVEEATDEGWLIVVYAKKLMESASKKSENLKRLLKNDKKKLCTEIEKTYKSVIKIFEFIENKDLFKPDSDIETTLFNLQGKVFWEWYKTEKVFFIEKRKKESKELEWKNWWAKEEEKNKLKKSLKYYQKSLNIADQTGDDADETLGNIALVLIELSKFSPKSKKSRANLNDAIAKLEKKVVTDFNSYWDHAKALFYLNPEENERKIKELLTETISDINNKFDKDFFIKRLNAEFAERIDGKPGFPGDQKIIENIEERFKERNLS